MPTANSYSKYAMRGVLAGLMTGVAVCVIFFLLFPTIEGIITSLLREQLLRQLPPDKVEEVLKNAESTINLILTIAPVIQIIQYLILGAIFGVLQGFYSLRFGLSDVKSAIASGITYVVILHVLPLIIVALALREVFEVLVSSGEYLVYMTVLVPGTLFTTSLVLVSLGGGSFSKFVEAEPRQT
ncbi:MAG: hypothetical protein QXH57_05245 [Sulfolobales archaeon]